MDEILNYSENLYVEGSRNRELELIDKVVARAEEKSSKPRTVVIQGPRGSGKSWLAFHLTRLKDNENHPALSQAWRFLIALSSESTSACTAENEICIALADTEAKRERQHFLDLIHARLVRPLARYIGADDNDAVSADQSLHWVLDRLDTTGRVLVVTVDSAFETNPVFLIELERMMLAPLSKHARVVIVLTGRGDKFDWSEPNLRIQVEQPGGPLEVFDESDTQRQIERQIPEAAGRATEIFELSGGHPLVNRMLAECLARGDSIEKALLDVKPQLFRNVPESQREEVEFACEALCPLDSFRIEDMIEMLNAHPNGQHDYDKPRAREIRDRLREYHLLGNLESGDYQLDATVRNFQRAFLGKTQSPLWNALNCRAYQMYAKWAEEDHSAFYRERAQWHREQLDRPDDCARPIETANANEYAS